MSTDRLILFWLLLMCVVVGLCLTTPEPADGHGALHETQAAMFRGSSTPPPDRILFLGWVFGLTIVGFFVTCMSLGITRSPLRPHSLLRVLFGVGMILYAGVVTMMVLADRTAVSSGEVTYLGWFPAATSWMLLGMWFAPLVFVAAYFIGFQQWIMPPESMSKFEELFASNRSHDSPRDETKSPVA